MHAMDVFDKYRYSSSSSSAPLPFRRRYHRSPHAGAPTSTSSSTSASASASASASTSTKRRKTDVLAAAATAATAHVLRSPYFSTSPRNGGKLEQEQEKKKRKIVVSPYFNHNYGPEFEVEIAQKKNEGNTRVVSPLLQDGSFEKSVSLRVNQGSRKCKEQEQGKKKKKIVVSPYFNHNYGPEFEVEIAQKKNEGNTRVVSPLLQDGSFEKSVSLTVSQDIGKRKEQGQGKKKKKIVVSPYFNHNYGPEFEVEIAQKKNEGNTRVVSPLLQDGSFEKSVSLRVNQGSRKCKEQEQGKKKKKIVVSPYFNHNYGPEFEVEIAQKKNEGNTRVVSPLLQDGTFEKSVCLTVNQDSGKCKEQEQGKKRKKIVISPYFNHNYGPEFEVEIAQKKNEGNTRVVSPLLQDGSFEKSVSLTVNQDNGKCKEQEHGKKKKKIVVSPYFNHNYGPEFEVEIAQKKNEGNTRVVLQDGSFEKSVSLTVSQDIGKRKEQGQGKKKKKIVVSPYFNHNYGPEFEVEIAQKKNEGNTRVVLQDGSFEKTVIEVEIAGKKNAGNASVVSPPFQQSVGLTDNQDGGKSKNNEQEQEKENVVVSPYFNHNYGRGIDVEITRKKNVGKARVGFPHLRDGSSGKGIGVRVNQGRGKGKCNSKEQEKKEKIVVSPYFNHNYGPGIEIQVARKKNEGKTRVASPLLQHGSSEKGVGLTVNQDRGKGKSKDKGKAKVVVVSPYFEHHKYNNGNYKVVVKEKEIKNPQGGNPFSSLSPSPSPSPSSPAMAGDGHREGNYRGRGRDTNRCRRVRFSPLLKAYRRKRNDNYWIPPESIHRLLQEGYYKDPWKVLVICMLLNRTTGNQARRVISDLFNLCPDAKAAIKVETDEIEKVIHSLGLQKKRSRMIQRFSWEYLNNEWTHVSQLHGIGKYASDAYAIFCNGSWKDVRPDDHKLQPYWEYLRNSIGNQT